MIVSWTEPNGQQVSAHASLIDMVMESAPAARKQGGNAIIVFARRIEINGVILHHSTCREVYAEMLHRWRQACVDQIKGAQFKEQ